MSTLIVERTVGKNPRAMVVSIRNRAGELGMGIGHTWNKKIPREV